MVVSGTGHADRDHTKVHDIRAGREPRSKLTSQGAGGQAGRVATAGNSGHHRDGGPAPTGYAGIPGHSKAQASGETGVEKRAGDPPRSSPRGPAQTHHKYGNPEHPGPTSDESRRPPDQQHEQGPSTRAHKSAGEAGPGRACNRTSTSKEDKTESSTRRQPTGQTPRQGTGRRGSTGCGQPAGQAALSGEGPGASAGRREVNAACPARGTDRLRQPLTPTSTNRRSPVPATSRGVAGRR